MVTSKAHLAPNLKGSSLGPALDSATSAAASAATSAASALSALPSGADIGQFIREQRQHAKLSLRRLAEDAGVSNPYLSQIERGLRKPSAEILQQLAKGLRISAEQLYVQAGLLEDRGTSQAVAAAIVSDGAINERQKRALLDIYASFVTENQPAAASAGTSAATATKTARQAARKPVKKSAKKSAKTAAKSPSKGATKSATKRPTRAASQPAKKPVSATAKKQAAKSTKNTKSTKKTARSTASTTRSKS